MQRVAAWQRAEGADRQQLHPQRHPGDRVPGQVHAQLCPSQQGENIREHGRNICKLETKIFETLINILFAGQQEQSLCVAT